MFCTKLSPTQKQMLSVLDNSQSKGISFLQMYLSPNRNHALHLLTHLQTQTVRQIKEEIQMKHQGKGQIERCKQFCSNFYYAYRNHSIKSSKCNWALFGIFAFSFLDVLCAWVMFKVTTYYFVGSEETTEVVESSVRSIMAAMGKFIGLFVLGSYSGLGIWHGSAFLLWCLDRYIYRRQQVIELKAQMKEQIRRHQNFN